MVDAASPIQVFPQLLAGCGDWIGELPGLIEAAVARDPRLGYLALGLAMLLENLIPPIPSELIQPLGGVLVQQGRLELVPVILVGTAGTVLGCWFWYGLGRWFGEERLNRWITSHGPRIGLNQRDLAASRAWFARHGVGLVFWGRLVPGLRTMISVPAGLDAMPMGLFLLATLAGSLLWVTVLTLLGRALGAGYGEVSQFTGPYGQLSRLLLLGLSGAAVIALVVRAWRRSGNRLAP
jgi:membrane protein DedA with SNARE-associated domain